MRSVHVVLLLLAFAACFAQASKFTPKTDFDWNWQYPAPTCQSLTVTYPANIPDGQANNVNIRVRLPGGSEITLNYHNNNGFWSGATVFDIVSKLPSGTTSYTIVWVQVGGTNYHWQGQVACSSTPPTNPPTGTGGTPQGACAVNNGNCGAHADCYGGVNGGVVTCVCVSGYYKDNTGVCVGVNVCATNNGGCHATHGICSTVIGTWDRTCTCAAGWNGPGANGYYCPQVTTPVDRCLTNNGGCHVNAVCYNGFAVDTPVTCVCKPNFFPANSASGPSLVCVGVNVCATNNGGCHAQATCATVVGTWDKTCTCKAGWNGPGANGYYCPQVTVSVDRCLTNNGGCHINAVCYNGFAVDTPVTCVCKPNFYPTSSASGTSLVCVGVNVCATNNGGCEAAHGICSTVIGTWDRTCTCAEGWNGPGANGYYCPQATVSVDRCLTNNGGCTVNAVCYNGFAVNSPVTCVCKPNFYATNPSASGPSLVCVGVNVCATNNGGCHAQATCATTVGTWDKTCTCKAGFQGDGYYCAPATP